MSDHPCLAEAPPPADDGHRHTCIHDATRAWGTQLEHRCQCGHTWIESAVATWTETR